MNVFSVLAMRMERSQKECRVVIVITNCQEFILARSSMGAGWRVWQFVGVRGSVRGSPAFVEVVGLLQRPVLRFSLISSNHAIYPSSI